jgi:glycosyltransferase involved in cell wall biosynthesis
MVIKGQIDVLYTHCDIHDLAQVGRMSNDFVWIARVPLDTEEMNQTWPELLKRPDYLVTEGQHSLDLFKREGFNNVEKIFPLMGISYMKRKKVEKKVFPWRNPDDFMMLSVARPFWRKNIPMILMGLYKLVHEEHLKNIKLFMHSDFDDTKATQLDYNLLIHAMGLEKNVLMPADMSFHSGVDEEVMAALYQSSDVTVSPNLGEGFGITLGESLLCGTPIITTDYTTGPELVGKDRGKLIKVSRVADIDGVARPLPDMESFVDAIKFYYDNPDERMAHGENAYKWANDELDVLKISKQWMDLIDRFDLNTVIMDENKIRGAV